jgi:very-short-patch-repair endonuclease
LRPAAQIADGTADEIERILAVSIPRTPAMAIATIGLLEGVAAAPLDDFDRRNPFVVSAAAAPWLEELRVRIENLRTSKVKLLSMLRESAIEQRRDDLEEWSAALAQPGFFARFGRRWRTASEAWARLARPPQLKANARLKSETFYELREFLVGLASLSADTDLRARLGVDPSPELGLEPLIRLANWADDVRSRLKGDLASAILGASASQVLDLRSVDQAERRDALRQVSEINVSGSDHPSFWAMAVAACAPEGLRELLVDSCASDDWDRLLSIAKNCSEAAQLATEAEERFVVATALDRELWFGSELPPELERIESRARRASVNSASLAEWLSFDQAYRSCRDQLEWPLVVSMTQGAVALSVLELGLDFLVFDVLARQAFHAAPKLINTPGHSLDSLRHEYAVLDAQVMELRRAKIAATLLQALPPAGRQSGLKSELTEMALIRAELAKQKRHIAIRQFVGRAGRALQALKPCFMMGPLSVARYIAPGRLKFDLVVMDEASQMRPEDAIGALARGGQAIIVGDPKQLPPTSFFDRIADGQDGDDSDAEVTLAEEGKSILEVAETVFGQRRVLKWHYRSRHESLIAFSNHHFYQNDLIVFPSPSRQDGRLGVGWHFVASGLALGGVNPEEARVVARAAATFLLEQRGRSLGVVAMNVKQAQRISDELASLAAADPLLAKALSEAENDNRGEPFFVKNLENVQGDERDVIMISMTYGPSVPAARVPQNFGPINQDTGWRRLNVLFTRAKDRMEAFSSMRASDILPKEGTDRGPRALKQFLEYAETGHLGVAPHRSDRDPDSDFENAVLEGLRELGFQCVDQLGVANFYLDIAVCDPGRPEEFIAAVECDGAAYHSTKSARDRDRLRQEILENLGWKFIRVWSTDWFRDPRAELARVTAELQRLIAAAAERRGAVRAQPTRPQQATDQETAPTERTLFPAVQPSRRKFADILSPEQARAELIDLREREIKNAFPNSDPTRGVLRKSVLDELLRKRPADMEEFRNTIRLDLRESTDAAQLKQFGERIFEVLANIEA